MSVESVIEQLQANARTLYRKAIDADARLDKLSADGMGKHQTIFKSDQGFTSQSPRFMPYVEELGRDILALQEKSSTEFEQSLKPVVKKMELLFTTLAKFKSSFAEN